MSVAPVLAHAEREAMILQYYTLVKNIARKMVGRFPRNIDIDDLINVGCLGLIDAIDRYTPERAGSFRAYAEMRIRGRQVELRMKYPGMSGGQSGERYERERSPRSFHEAASRESTASCATAMVRHRSHLFLLPGSYRCQWK